MLAGSFLASVVLVSCGGGASRQDTIRAWDATCRATQARLEAIQVPNVSSKKDLSRFVTAIGKALPIALNEVDELRAIPVPDEDQQTLDGILSDLVHSAGQLRAAQRAAKKGDLAKTKAALSKSATDTRKAGAAAKAYGMQVCGQSS